MHIVMTNSTITLFKGMASGKTVPSVIVEKILSYCHTKQIIYFQKKYPRLLQIVLISNIYSVLQSRRHYIRKLYKCGKAKYSVAKLINLTHVTILTNLPIINDELFGLHKLIYLNCDGCHQVTDTTINKLKNLVELRCDGCK